MCTYNKRTAGNNISSSRKGKTPDLTIRSEIFQFYILLPVASLTIFIKKKVFNSVNQNNNLKTLIELGPWYTCQVMYMEQH